MKRNRIVIVGSALRVVSLTLTMLVGFYLMPFLVHRLGDRMFGYWALIGAMLGYYGILDLGITPAVQFQIAKAIGKGDTEAPNRALSTAVVAFAGLGLIALVITVVVALCCPLFVKNASDIGVFRWVLVILGIGFAFGFPGRAFMGAVYAHLRIDLNSSVSIVVLILRTVLTVFVIMRGKGLVGLALVSLMSDVLTYIANYLILRRIQPGLRISIALADKSMFKELLHYGGYSVVIQVGDQLRFAVDSWMVAAFVGVGAVAHYAIGSRLSNYFLIFMISTVGVLSPWFSQLLGSQDLGGIRKMLAMGTKVATVLSTVIACSFVFYGRAFISRWMGPSYVDAYWPSVILIAAIFCDVAQQPSVAYLLGVSRHRYLAYQTLAEGVANLALSMYWARHYGMAGVAMGTLVPMIVAKIFLQPAYVCRSMGAPLLDYYVTVFAKSAMVPAVCAFAIWRFLFRGFDFTSLGQVCGIVLLQACVCAVVSLFFVFDGEDRSRLLSRLWPQRTARVESAAAAALGGLKPVQSGKPE